MGSLVNAPSLQTGVKLSLKDRAAASYQSTGVDVTDYEGMVAFEQGLISATGAQTEAAIIQTAEDSGFTVGVATVATFTTYTQSDLERYQRIVVDLATCKRYVRVNATLAGSTPAISSAYFMTATKKYQP